MDSIAKNDNSTRVLNVKTDCGAFGDGKHDDTQAIQKALDELRFSGGTVIVPNGVYNITACLIIYSNQTLKLDKNATIKRCSEVKYMVAVYTRLLACRYNGTHDIRIEGGTFDAGEDVRMKVTIINTCHTKRAVISGCNFIHGCEWHCIEVNSSKDVLIENCHFDGRTYVITRPTGKSELIQVDAAVIGLYGPVYRRNMLMPFFPDATACNGVTIKNCTFWCKGMSAIGMHSNYPHKNIHILDNKIIGTSNIADTSRGVIIFLPRVSGVVVSGNEFVSDEPKGTRNTAIHIENKNKNACVAERNVFVGNYKPYFEGGITESNNAYKENNK